MFNNQEGEKHFRQVQSNVDFSLLGLRKAQNHTTAKLHFYVVGTPEVVDAGYFCY